MVYTFTEPRSHAGVWLAEMFPHRRELRGEMLARLGAPSAIEDDLLDKSFFGRIVEHALSLTLAAPAADLRLLACLPPAHALRVLTLAGYQSPPSPQESELDHWQPSEDPQPPDAIFTAASCLSLVEVWMRQFGIRRPDVIEVVRRHFERHPDDLVHRDAGQERLVFHNLWTTHSHGFHDALRSYGAATVQLPLLDGRHHADFLLGTTLVEVKAGRLDLASYLDALIDQLLRYTLLALHDGHAVSHVAVYATRHRRLLRYPATEFLYELHGGLLDLPGAATTLAHRVLTDQPQAPRSVPSKAGAPTREAN